MSKKELAYKTALEHLNKAKEILHNNGRLEDGFYQDKKYVKMACRKAYKGVLISIEAILKNRAESNKEIIRPSDYQIALSSIDIKLRNEFNSSYQILYLGGQCDGITDCEFLRIGLERANTIIKRISPSREF